MGNFLRRIPRNRRNVLRFAAAGAALILCLALMAPGDAKVKEAPRDFTPERHVVGGASTDLECPGSEAAIVNPHPFRVLISPKEFCDPSKPALALIYVYSRPNNFRTRDVIRSTWGNATLFPALVRVVFVLGTMPHVPDVQASLRREARLHNDIVQEDFLDSYKNLTYKAIGALRWASGHCARARFVIKVDDDVFVDTFSLMRVLERLEPANRSDAADRRLLCRVWRGMEVRRAGKWRVDRAEYAANHYPTYCSGMAYVMTSAAASALYLASCRTPIFWVEDVYVTGLLAKASGIELADMAYHFVLDPMALIREKHRASLGGASPIFAHSSSSTISLRGLWENIVDLEKRRTSPWPAAVRSSTTSDRSTAVTWLGQASRTTTINLPDPHSRTFQATSRSVLSPR